MSYELWVMGYELGCGCECARVKGYELWVMNWGVGVGV